MIIKNDENLPQRHRGTETQRNDFGATVIPAKAGIHGGEVSRTLWLKLRMNTNEHEWYKGEMATDAQRHGWMREVKNNLLLNEDTDRIRELLLFVVGTKSNQKAHRSNVAEAWLFTLDESAHTRCGGASCPSSRASIALGVLPRSACRCFFHILSFVFITYSCILVSISGFNHFLRSISLPPCLCASVANKKVYMPG